MVLDELNDINRYYFEKAEANTPKFHHKTVKSDRTVKIVPSKKAFFGCKAKRDGKLPELLKRGDSFIIDFGRHCVGRLSFTLKHSPTKYLDAPVRLKLRFAEVPYELMRDNASYPGKWLCPSWLAEEIINIDMIGRTSLPRRYSFRYLEVTVVASPRPLVLSDFAVRTETTADVSALTPLPADTDPMLIKIDKIAAATLRDCMQSAYEDGPKRDRRLWSGDLRLQALTDNYLFKNEMLARRCLYLFAACVRKNHYLPACLYQYPELYFDTNIEIPDYSMLYCVSIYDYLEHTGDAETVLDLFPVVENEIDHALSCLDENGVITFPDPREGWDGFIDWVDGKKNRPALMGVLLYALKRVIMLANKLGKTEQAAKWQSAYESCMKTVKEKLFCPEKGVFLSEFEEMQLSVHTQVWMILGEAIEGEAAKKALLTAMADETSLKPVTPYMHHYLVDAMLTAGMMDEAKEHLISYWGDMANEGADTFWEVYVKDHPEISPYFDPIVHSFCHAWSASPSYFIRKYFIQANKE